MDYNTYQQLLNTITGIKNGDQSALEKLVEEYKPFILKTASQFCRRMLEWGRDDELSIGLIAFNSAIDAFDPDKQVPFLSFSRLVILSRLKDFARKEGKYQSVYQLDDETLASSLEGQITRDDYLNRTIEDERREELERFENMLSAYSISFEDLVEVSPRHSDSRLVLLGAACKLAQTASLMEHLTTKKQLPLNELEKACGVKRKTLERGRKFIVASALIINMPDQFIYLRSYINFSC
jgi:RNA polymerase sigma factor